MTSTCRNCGGAKTDLGSDYCPTCSSTISEVTEYCTREKINPLAKNELIREALSRHAKLGMSSRPDPRVFSPRISTEALDRRFGIEEGSTLDPRRGTL